MKKKADAVIEAIEGYQIEDSQKNCILFVHAHMDFLAEKLKSLDVRLDELVAPYEKAITLISEIGLEMSQFRSSKRLCCWAGLLPGNNESAGKKKSVRITRAGV